MSLSSALRRAVRTVVRPFAFHAAIILSLVGLAGCADPTGPAATGRTQPAERVSPLVVPVSGYTNLSAMTWTTCAVTAQTGIDCWGITSAGLPPVGLTGAVSVSVATSHGCAILQGGALTCWGALPQNGADFGQATVPSDLGAVTQVSTGTFYTCAVTTAQTVRCWGRSIRGESIVPEGLPAVRQVANGFVHTCVLSTAGTVQCWGANAGAEVVPAGLTGVVQIAAATAHTCALLEDGTVRCWGSEFNGRTAVPAGLTDVMQISAGEVNTCAVRRNGSVVCWGDDSAGQSTVPTDLNGVVSVSAAGYYTCALTTLGTVRCWGVNSLGQGTPPTTRVMPTATFVAPGTVNAGSPIVLSLTGAQVAGAPDATGFTYAFDCGDGAGFGTASSTSTISCPTSAAGVRTVQGQVIDESGDFSVYSATVEVVLTIRSLRADVAASGIARGVRLELLEALDDAQRAQDRGRPRAVCEALREFSAEVREERGRKIPLVTADRWLASAAQLRSQNRC